MKNLLPESVIRDGTLRIDWTTFSNVLECNRKAWHLAVCERELDFDDPSRTFGKAVHAGLEEWQRWLMEGREDGEPLPLMECAVDKEFAGVNLPDGEFRSAGRAKDVLGLYVNRYETDDRLFDVVGNEEAGEKELGAVLVDTEDALLMVKVLWQYRIDGTWRDRCNGKLYIKDTKTSKRPFEEHGPSGGPGRDAVKYQMSGQLQGYCWVKGATGAVIDHIGVLPPLMRPTAKSPERNQFNRKLFEWSPGQLEEWRRRTLAQVEWWLVALAAGDAAALMNTNSCNNYSTCQFYECCEQRDEVSRLRWLASGKYRDRKWNPLDVRSKL